MRACVLQGKPYTSIQPESDLNSMCLVPESGLIFLANEAPKILSYYIPVSQLCTLCFTMFRHRVSVCVCVCVYFSIYPISVTGHSPQVYFSICSVSVTGLSPQVSFSICSVSVIGHSPPSVMQYLSHFSQWAQPPSVFHYHQRCISVFILFQSLGTAPKCISLSPEVYFSIYPVSVTGHRPQVYFTITRSVFQYLSCFSHWAQPPSVFHYHQKCISVFILFQSLGTAPKWCAFLDTLTEELEESEHQSGL